MSSSCSLVLPQLDVDVIHVSAQGRRSPSTEGADSPIDVINPGMLASILQRHSQCFSLSPFALLSDIPLVWLLRDAEHDHLMGEIERLPPSVETKVLLERGVMTSLTFVCTKIEENVLLAKLALHTVYAHLRSNINFGSFVESSRFICRFFLGPFLNSRQRLQFQPDWCTRPVEKSSYKTVFRC